MSKRNITHKNIEEICDKDITICFTVSGTFQGQFLGRIVARLRNRFKQYVFIPATPFATFCFSSGDVKTIEQLGDSFVLTIHDSSVKKKKRRKKKPNSTAVAAETESIIDLSNSVKVSEKNDLEFKNDSSEQKV